MVRYRRNPEPLINRVLHGGNWGSLRIRTEDWGNLRGRLGKIHHPPLTNLTDQVSVSDSLPSFIWASIVPCRLRGFDVRFFSRKNPSTDPWNGRPPGDLDTTPPKFNIAIAPEKLKNDGYRRWVSFWDGLFWGAMLNFRCVTDSIDYKDL